MLGTYSLKPRRVAEGHETQSNESIKSSNKTHHLIPYDAFIVQFLMTTTTFNPESKLASHRE